MYAHLQDDERQATPEKGRVGAQEMEAQAQAFPEQDLTDGVGNAPMPVYGLDSWNQELQALSPLDSFASPSAVSMELTDISQEYNYEQNDDVSHNLTGESADRTRGMSAQTLLPSQVNISCVPLPVTASPLLLACFTVIAYGR